MLARQQLTILGGLFLVAGTTVAYGDTGYPFLSAAFAAMLALSLGAALILATPFAHWRAGRVAIFAVGFTYFLDVAYIGTTPMSGALVALLACFIFYLIVWRNSTTLVPFATTAVAVSTLFILPQQVFSNANLTPTRIELATPGPEAKGRPFVHIILDEMGSLALMPKGPFYDGLRREIIADYRKRGFDLFEDTMSSAGVTFMSLGQVFAGHDGDMDNFSGPDGAFSYALGTNGATARLGEAGYGITILQNSFLELCVSERWRCLTYARGGDGAALMRHTTNKADGIDYALRATNSLLLLNDSSRSSFYYQALGQLAAYLGMAVPSWRLYYARPPQTIELMQHAAEGLQKLDGGEAVLLHLLVPHFPYMLDEHCRVKTPTQALAPVWVLPHLGIKSDTAAIERAYWEQVACVHRTLMTMLDAILQSPGGKDAVILIHGDHGSRLLKKLADPSWEAATEIERRSALLAHFAVRGVSDRHKELAAHHLLRDRVWTVLNAVLDDRRPDSGLITSAMH